MSGLNFAGEFSLKEMKLLTSSGAVIDIRKMTQSIEIFENIMSPIFNWQYYHFRY